MRSIKRLLVAVAALVVAVSIGFGVSTSPGKQLAKPGCYPAQSPHCQPRYLARKAGGRPPVEYLSLAGQSPTTNAEMSL